MPSRDTMNENAHAWITVALPTLLVCSDIVGILSGSDEPSLRRTRLYRASKLACVLCDSYPRAALDTPSSSDGRPSEDRQVFSSIDRDRWDG